MAGWDIELDGVASVLVRVAGFVEDPDDGLLKVVGDLVRHEDHARVAARSALIGAALREYLEYVGPQLDGMSSTVERCVWGVFDAAGAYVDGDLEMARRAENGAAGVPVPRIPRLGDR